MFSLICAWINGWVNNREAGDLRRHRAHYDVVVMLDDIICVVRSGETPVSETPVMPKLIMLIYPGRNQWNLRWVTLKLILVTDGGVISFEIALRLISLDLTRDKSTLVYVMAWCRHTTSHYLSQCWPKSMSPLATPILGLLGRLRLALWPYFLQGLKKKGGGGGG